jgi:NADH:ubiquinone oxidoreductase subunit 2 (subunit N)
MISSGNLLSFYVGLNYQQYLWQRWPILIWLEDSRQRLPFKFIISSAFSSALLLFGISLMYGATGSLDFEIIRQQLMEVPSSYLPSSCCCQALAFKISVVPSTYGLQMSTKVHRLRSHHTISRFQSGNFLRFCSCAVYCFQISGR